MSRILGLTGIQQESSPAPSDPVKLPHLPMAGVAIFAEADFTGSAIDYALTVDQGPTTAGPWVTVARLSYVDLAANGEPMINWLRFSATERYVRGTVANDGLEAVQASILWLDDPLLHWEPAP